MRIRRRCTARDIAYEVLGDGYTTTTSCSCGEFSTNGSCRHVNELRERTCMWDEADSPIPIGPDPTVCPMCGAPTAARVSEAPSAPRSRPRRS